MSSAERQFPWKNDVADPQACCPRHAAVETNTQQNSPKRNWPLRLRKANFGLNLLFCWCREGGANPHDRKGRRILSLILGILQSVAA